MNRKRKSRYHRGIYTSTKTGKDIHYRSGWEKSFAEYLDSDESVVTFSYEDVVISYVSNIKTRRTRNYYPDFFVTKSDGEKLLVEIKPQRFLNKIQNKKKWEAAKCWCSEHGVSFVILTEVDLKQMGVL